MMPVKFIKTDGAGIGDWRRFHVAPAFVGGQRAGFNLDAALELCVSGNASVVYSC